MVLRESKPLVFFWGAVAEVLAVVSGFDPAVMRGGDGVFQTFLGGEFFGFFGGVEFEADLGECVGALGPAHEGVWVFLAV